jgi:hypothetical protein
MPPRAALLSLLLAGCSAAPPPPTVVVEVTRPAPSLAPPAPRAALDPTPPALEVPGPAGCFSSVAGHVALRFRPDAPPFASLDDAGATVDFTTAGPAAGASVRAVYRGFTLGGIVAADEIPLVATRAVVLGGFVVPASGARLAWRATALGAITVGFTPDDVIEVLPGAQLDATVLPCAAVTTEGAAPFELGASIPRAPRETRGFVPAGKSLGLSRTPGGPPVARLRAGAEGAEVTVVETRGPHALVRHAGGRQVVFGWVPARDVQPPTQEINDTFGVGCIGLTGLPAAGRPLRVVHCENLVPLVAEQAGERRTVGSVAAGAALPLGEARDGLVSVVLPAALHAAPDARLGVLATHVAGCPAD